MNSHPTILIAVDVGDGAERSARAAAVLFGTDARYRFAHVAPPTPLSPPVSATFPSAAGVAPIGAAPVDTSNRVPEEAADTTIESAKAVASRAANEAGIPMAESVGLIGHPADAIIDEAVSCGADAIVVSPHQHGWIDRVFHRSVSDEIQKTSPVPIVVVPGPA